MQEHYYASCRVWAYVVWAAVIALLISAWLVMLAAPRQWRLAFLLGGSACVLSPMAATLHIRSFAVRVSSLIRAGSYRTDLEGSGLRPVR